MRNQMEIVAPGRRPADDLLWNRQKIIPFGRLATPREVVSKRVLSELSASQRRCYVADQAKAAHFWALRCSCAELSELGQHCFGAQD